MSVDLKSPGALEKAVNDAIKGLTTSWPKGSKSITIDGTAFAIPTLIKTLEGHAAKFKAVHDTETAYKSALSTRQAIEPAVHKFLLAFHDALPVAIGSKSALLPNFGATPKKERAVVPVAKKAEAASKAKATRAARGTTKKK